MNPFQRLYDAIVADCTRYPLDQLFAIGLHPLRIALYLLVVDLLDRIATQKGATPAQIALAWLLAQKRWIVPIPGSRKLDRLEENIGAVAVALTPDDLGDIENAMAKITVVGDRY